MIEELIQIPENVTHIDIWVFSGALSLFTAIVIWLIRDRGYLIKRLKDSEEQQAKNIAAHIEDLKEQKRNIQDLADAKTKLLLEALETKIDKLENIWMEIKMYLTKL